MILRVFAEGPRKIIDEAIDEPVFQNAAQLLQIDQQLITNSINQLFR